MQGYLLKFWHCISVICCLYAGFHLQAQNPETLNFPENVVLPPSGLHGFQTENQFADQADIINVIKWNPPTSGNQPVSYHIYRNSNLTRLAAIIPADQKLEFKDHNRKKHHTYLYCIVSVDAAGTPSDPICIRFKGAKTHVIEIKSQLAAIEIFPLHPTLAEGFTLPFKALGIFKNGSTKDITKQVQWSSSNAHVASISNKHRNAGLAAAKRPGTTEIKANLHGVADFSTLTVTDATLTSIEVFPIKATITAGLEQQFQAIGTFSDHTTQNLTHAVTWSSSQPSIASISNKAKNRGLATGLSSGTTQIEATIKGVTGVATLTVTSAALVSIEVAPINPKIPPGSKHQFTAIGVFSDKTVVNITNQVIWDSSDKAVATISNAPNKKGIATTLTNGTTTITAALNGIFGSTTLTVASLVSIEVEPVNPRVPQGYAKQFKAIGVYTDQSKRDLTEQVTWTSSNTGIAKISNVPGRKGRATTLLVGTTTITATLKDIIGSTTLTVTSAVLVSIEVAPFNSSVANGLTEQFTATGIFSDKLTSDLTDQVTWFSSNPSIAAISNAQGNEGLATALTAGQTTISAALNGITGSTEMTVTGAVLETIEVTPTNPTVALGFTQQFTATGIFSDQTKKNLTTQVTWESSNTSVAAISNAAGKNGLATTLQQGNTTISASLNGITGSTTLTVSSAVLVSIDVQPTNPSVPKGLAKQFTATGLLSDNKTIDLTDQAAWSSSDRSIATISNIQSSKGLATAITVGQTTISATYQGITGSTTLTVSAAILETIEVTPPNPKTPLGFAVQFTATGIFSDKTTGNLTKQVTWESSDTSVAEISNFSLFKGLAISLHQGSTTISATLNGITGSTTMTVTPAVLVAIEVEPFNPHVPNGLNKQFKALCILSNGAKIDLTDEATWSSSNPLIAKISNAKESEGLATTLAVGQTTIEAAFRGKMGSSTLTVTAAVLASIEVTPPDPQVALGLTQQFTATGTLTDHTTEDITTQVTWESAIPLIATISNAQNSQGLATTVKQGSTTILATLNGIRGFTTLTVTAAALESISVTPSNPTISVDGTQQFTATGSFSDGTQKNITADASWSSSNQNIATVSNAGGTQGLATGASPGQTIITATLSGMSGSTTLNVICPSFQILTNPPPPNGIACQPYGPYQIQTNSIEPVTFTLNSSGCIPPIPAGLELSPSGLISGIPQGPGCSPACIICVTATNSCGKSTSEFFQIQIGCTIPNFANSPPSGSLNVPYSFQFEAMGANGCTITYTLEGSLPPGLTLSSNGLISGTPTSIGNFTFRVDISDNCGLTSVPFSIAIGP